MGGARRARGFGAGAGGWDGPAAGARGRALPRMAPRHGSGRAAVGQGAGWAGLRRVRACARSGARVAHESALSPSGHRHYLCTSAMHLASDTCFWPQSDCSSQRQFVCH